MMLRVIALYLLLIGCSQGEPGTEAGGTQANAASSQSPVPGRLARIEDHNPVELGALLHKAEALLADNAGAGYPDYQPIEFILHGPEAQIFVRANYARYQELVDRAARLDAFGIIDIKICEAWMSGNGVERVQLPAFIETVPYGPAEEQRLFREGYSYF